MAKSVKDFSIHKGVLVFYSNHFGTIFGNSGAKTQSNHIDLSTKVGVDVKTFDLSKGWLYTRKLRDNLGLLEYNLTFSVLCDVWIFANEYRTPLSMNHSINLILRSWR